MDRETNFRRFFENTSRYGVPRTDDDRAEIEQEIREMGQELNDQAQARYGRDWEDLSQAEREAL